MAVVRISVDTAPALGDLRLMGEGDTIYTHGDWAARRDAGRYADAIAAAVLRGASVQRVTP